MNDQGTVRIVIGFLGIAVLLCIAGGFYLAASAVEVPEFLVGLGGTALGALGSLLARTGNESVTLDQPASRPVPVTDVDSDEVLP